MPQPSLQLEYVPSRSPGVPVRPIASVKADDSAGREGNGFEIWHEACRPVLDVVSRAPLQQFHTAFEFYNVDGLIFNRVSYSAATFKRTSRHLRGGDGDLILVHMLLRGAEAGEVEGRPLRMDPQRIVVQDWAHAYETATEPTEQLSVAIPRERLAARDLLYKKRPVVDWANDSPQGMLLGNAVRAIWAVLPQVTQAHAQALAAGFLGMLDGLLDPTGESAVMSVPSRHTLAAMKDFLTRRMQDSTLDVDDLALAFNCSRATVYRLFRECGGVRTFLAEQRLSEAYRILSRPTHVRESIALVADALGYRDVGHFHRVFKKRFGITPGEARDAGSGLASETGRIESSTGLAPELAKLHRWLGARG